MSRFDEVFSRFDKVFLAIMIVSVVCELTILLVVVDAQVSPELADSISLGVAEELANDPKNVDLMGEPDDAPVQVVSAPLGQVPWGWVAVPDGSGNGTYLKERVFKATCTACGCADGY